MLTVLTFNTMLALGELDPAEVRLLRHIDKQPSRQRKLVEAAVKGQEDFERYQEEQGTPQVVKAFEASRYFASFVVDPTSKETLFVGVWENHGKRQQAAGAAFDLTPNPKAAHFDLRRLERFDGYRGRLVIDWGDGTRAWVQRADKQDKPIVELRPQVRDPEFRGFLQFRRGLDEVDALPTSWKAALKSVRGIYLIVHRTTGKQYVGSATGAGGFLGRWLTYASGHGGNVGLKELGAAADTYDVAILEVASSDATAEAIFARESLWKDKLGSKVTGLNRN